MERVTGIPGRGCDCPLGSVTVANLLPCLPHTSSQVCRSGENSSYGVRYQPLLTASAGVCPPGPKWLLSFYCGFYVPEICPGTHFAVQLSGIDCIRAGVRPSLFLKRGPVGYDGRTPLLISQKIKSAFEPIITFYFVHLICPLALNNHTNKTNHSSSLWVGQTGGWELSSTVNPLSSGALRTSSVPWGTPEASPA